MLLTVNGSKLELEKPLTIRDLATHMKIEGPIAVEVNREIVTRTKHAEHVLQSGDSVEIVQFVGGG